MQADLDLGLFDYDSLYNNARINGSLGYLTPKAYKDQNIAILSTA
ncbi:IS3 family transposase [Aerococcaceae bacterium INB8]|uniref:IS3 family transposase n=1 Tax=Ruoffia halotolerans TaxID=2748684 RepID=A0A839A2M7_9LACT|nr:IS3 family transposase [Ruoffia halotolerans]